MARSGARTVRPSVSSAAADKLAAALAAVGHAHLRDTAEYRRMPLYYDAVAEWFGRLSADDQELCRTLADVMAGPHKASADNMAASLPPAPRCPS
jgi:hypothetical protein